MFEVNHCFEIGSSHLVCQDYAISGQIQTENGLYHYGILSDGCSSSKDTDVGSRYLAMATRRILTSELKKNTDIFNINMNELGTKIITEASGYIDSDLLMENNSFDATLLFFISDDTQYRAVMFGDGAIFVEDNCRRIYSLEYQENTPPYLSYKLNADRLWGYSGKIGCTNKNLNVWNVTNPNAPLLETQVTTKIVDAPYFEICGRTEELVKLAIFSDGVYSFEKFTQGIVKIDFLESAERYLNYPVKKGEFLTRNFKHNAKENTKSSVRHFDDLSCVAIVRS